MGTLCPTHMICFKHTLVFIGNFTPHINKFVEHLMLYTLYGFVYGWGFYRPFTKPKYIVFGSVISAILRALVAERDLTWCRRRCVCVCLRVCLDRLLCKIQNGVANTLDAPMRSGWMHAFAVWWMLIVIVNLRRQLNKTTDFFIPFS